MPSVLRDPHHLEIVREDRRRLAPDLQAFDRVTFALRVLSFLQPPKWNIALYVRDGDFYLDRGRDLRRGNDAVWGTVGIPRFASRAEIAATLAEFTGTRNAPFVLDLLASDESALAKSQND